MARVDAVTGFADVAPNDDGLGVVIELINQRQSQDSCVSTLELRSVRMRRRETLENRVVRLLDAPAGLLSHQFLEGV